MDERHTTAALLRTARLIFGAIAVAGLCVISWAQVVRVELAERSACIAFGLSGQGSLAALQERCGGEDPLPQLPRS